MTEKNVSVVIALANNRLNATDASYWLGVHRNTVLNHIEKVKEETGLDPLEFYDMCKLLIMIRGERWMETKDEESGWK